jgi:hypothetical protein
VIVPNSAVNAEALDILSGLDDGELWDIVERLKRVKDVRGPPGTRVTYIRDSAGAWTETWSRVRPDGAL